jgi:hypothetical protein
MSDFPNHIATLTRNSSPNREIYEKHVSCDGTNKAKENLTKPDMKECKHHFISYLKRAQITH